MILQTQELKERHLLLKKQSSVASLNSLRNKLNLAITDIRIVLFKHKQNFESKDKTMKREIKLVDLKGITKSTLKDVNSFVIHVKNSYDEYFYSSDKTEIIEAAKKVYANICHKNLPIFGIPHQSLKSYVTSEKDAALEISRMPLRKFRLKSERFLEDVESSDEDEDEKELFDEFVVVDPDEGNKIDEFLKTYNKPEILEEEEKQMNEDRSELVSLLQEIYRSLFQFYVNFI